jgi:hypothetical protein
MKFNVKEVSVAGILFIVLIVAALCTYSFVIQPMANGDKPDLPGLNIGGDGDQTGDGDTDTTSGPYQGQLKVNFQFFDGLNNDAASTGNMTIKLYHANKESIFGTTTTVLE